MYIYIYIYIYFYVSIDLYFYISIDIDIDINRYTYHIDSKIYLQREQTPHELHLPPRRHCRPRVCLPAV